MSAELPQTVRVLDTLRKNCHLGKHRHFAAASRTHRLHICFGIPLIVINVILGSTFFVLVTKEIPVEAKWTAAIGALLAALLGAVQTFFNFQKKSESHRTVANQYLALQRECERLLASYCDGLLALEPVSLQLESLNARYQEVNKAAEGLRTTQGDYTSALQEVTKLEAAEKRDGLLLCGQRAQAAAPASGDESKGSAR